MKKFKSHWDILNCNKEWKKTKLNVSNSAFSGIWSQAHLLKENMNSTIFFSSLPIPADSLNTKIIQIFFSYFDIYYRIFLYEFEISQFHTRTRNTVLPNKVSGFPWMLINVFLKVLNCFWTIHFRVGNQRFRIHSTLQLYSGNDVNS